MKNFLLLSVFCFFLTACHTTLQTVEVKEVRHIIGITAEGDTVNVDVDRFRSLLYHNPSHYHNYRFYYRDRWITPYSYYRFYYTPYRPIWVNYSYTPVVVTVPTTAPIKPTTSKPRSSGLTSQVTRPNPPSKSRHLRSSGSTSSSKSVQVKRSVPQSKSRGTASVKRKEQ